MFNAIQYWQNGFFKSRLPTQRKCPMFKTITLATLALLLSACGGGSDIGPVVTSVQGMSLRFG